MKSKNLWSVIKHRHLLIGLVLLLLNVMFTPGNYCSECNSDPKVKSLQRKCDKFSAEYLLTHSFPAQISDDVDMDPCKSSK